MYCGEFKSLGIELEQCECNGSVRVKWFNSPYYSSHPGSVETHISMTNQMVDDLGTDVCARFSRRVDTIPPQLQGATDDLNAVKSPRNPLAARAV